MGNWAFVRSLRSENIRNWTPTKPITPSNLWSGRKTPSIFRWRRRGSRIRKIISPENAMQLLEKIPQLDTIQRANRKETQQALEQSMKTHLCEEWCRVLKTLYPSRVNLQGGNHKRSATEELLWRTAEGCLVGELSFALGESKEDARERLKSCFRHAAFQC